MSGVVIKHLKSSSWFQCKRLVHVCVAILVGEMAAIHVYEVPLATSGEGTYLLMHHQAWLITLM